MNRKSNTRTNTVYSLLHWFYRLTPVYKKKVSEQKSRSARIREERERKRTGILDKLDFENLMVLNGPFKGMKYITESSGSQLLPKILGSYEEPIHEWINEIIREDKYDCIIDIGCAEGYYAVGFGIKLPETTIFAFDVDKKAIHRAKQLSALNNTTNIRFGNHCCHEDLSSLITGKTLIFCDIEGAEDEVLDPIHSPELLETDILVETHDCFRPGVSDRLIDRFYDTHKIQICVDYPFRVSGYSLPDSCHLDEHEILFAQDEIRPPKMRFLFMRNRIGCE